MRIVVIGTGYVGLVAGTCLAEIGHNIICVDIDETKIEQLKAGQIPIYEPGLEDLIPKNVNENRLSFTTNLSEAMKDTKVVFIAVGTPQGNDGKADLKYVKQVAESIGENIQDYIVVVDKSTVPIGTGDLVKKIIASKTSKEFDVVSNPEFLREGLAVKDFLEGDRIVIGHNSEKAKKIMEEVYAPLKMEKIFTDIRSAEMIKYASNAFLATKISFINEIANLCEKVGANVEDVAKGMGTDHRIGNQFLKAGTGYGGSCFPKDVQALIHIAKDNDCDFKIVEATQEVNKKQKTILFEKIKQVVGEISGKKIGILGLAFKPDTDDMREAPSISLINLLLENGAEIKAYDPVATEQAKKIFGDKIRYADNLYEVADQADLVVLVTEWEQFKEMNLEQLKQKMNKPIFIDGRNIFNPKQMRENGFEYLSVGR